MTVDQLVELGERLAGVGLEGAAPLAGVLRGLASWLSTATAALPHVDYETQSKVGRQAASRGCLHALLWGGASACTHVLCSQAAPKKSAVQPCGSPVADAERAGGGGGPGGLGHLADHHQLTA